MRAKAITNGIVVNVDDTIGLVSFLGYSLRATADAVANVRQGSSTGLILATIALAAPAAGSKSSETVMFDAEDPLRCEGDLYFELVSGTLVGSLYYN